jgi:hypothetical protein
MKENQDEKIQEGLSWIAEQTKDMSKEDTIKFRLLVSTFIDTEIDRKSKSSIK